MTQSRLRPTAPACLTPPTAPVHVDPQRSALQAALANGRLIRCTVCVLERAKAGAALADFIEHVEQISRASRQPVEAHHDQHVVLLKPADDLGQLGPIGLGAAGLSLETPWRTPRPATPRLANLGLALGSRPARIRTMAWSFSPHFSS